MSVGDGYFYAYFTIDPDLVDLEKVEVVEFTAKNLSGESILVQIEECELDTGSGELSAFGEIDEALASDEGYFIAAVKLRYTDPAVGPVPVEWVCEPSIEISLYLPEWYPPSFISASAEPDPSDNPNFTVSFVLLMNDAEAVTARLYYSEGVSNWNYTECDPEYGIVELSFDNTENPSAYWYSAANGENFFYSLSLPDTLPGAFFWFNIEFECTMPEGEVCYIYSSDIPAFCGSFFEPQNWTGYYNPPEQSFNCGWNIYRELAPDISDVSVESIKLVPVSDGFSTVVIPNDELVIAESDGNGSYYAHLALDGLELSSETEWTIELTMTCSNGQYTWTRTSSAPVSIVTKHTNRTVHYPILSLMGPAGGKYYEEKE